MLIEVLRMIEYFFRLERSVLGKLEIIDRGIFGDFAKWKRANEQISQRDR